MRAALSVVLMKAILRPGYQNGGGRNKPRNKKGEKERERETPRQAERDRKRRRIKEIDTYI